MIEQPAERRKLVSQYEARKKRKGDAPRVPRIRELSYSH